MIKLNNILETILPIKEEKNIAIHWTDREGLLGIFDSGYLDEGTSLTTTFQLSFDKDNNKPFGLILDRKKVEELGYWNLDTDEVGVTPMELRYELRGDEKIPLKEYFMGFCVRNNTNKIRLQKIIDNSVYFWGDKELQKYNDKIKVLTGIRTVDMLYNPKKTTYI
jgi:hypothetical protein